MKRIRVLLFALCVMLAASCFSITNVYAAESDGLSVTITADASEYNTNDTAIFTIEMSNEMSTSVTDVEYIVSLPQGMRAQDEASLKATISEISPGETVVKRTVEAYVYEVTAITDEQIPQTGDRSMSVVVVLAVVGLLAAVAGFTTKHKKSSVGVLAIALYLLASSLVFSGVSPAYANEYVSRQTEASCRVSVNGSQYDATVSISYTALEQTGTSSSSSEVSGFEYETASEASGFVYEIQQLADGTEVVRITGYTGSETSIIIPVQLDGKDVVAVSFDPSLVGYLSVEHISFESGSMVESFGYGYAGIFDEGVLASVDFSNASNIRTIGIDAPGTLTSLDLSGLSRLEYASYVAYGSVSGNTSSDGISSAFTGIVLKDNDALTELCVYAYTPNTTTAPDLSEAPNLTSLVLNWCGIESLDVSQNPKLTYLVCTRNKIRSLDASVLRSLAENNDEFVLDCSYNYIADTSELQAIADEFGLSRWTLTPQDW